MAQHFGKNITVTSLVTPHKIDLPLLGVTITFESDSKGNDFMVVQSTNGKPLELHPAAANTVGVRTSDLP